VLGALGTRRTRLVNGFVEYVVVVIVARQHELEAIGIGLQEADTSAAHPTHSIRDQKGEVANLLAVGQKYSD